MILIRSGHDWRSLEDFRSSDELVATIAKYGPSQCTCPLCVAMCQKNPCMGTPEDIEKLIDAGYARLLCLTEWRVGIPFGVPPILMIQLSGRQITCPLLKCDRCTLHAAGLKPTEGVRATCQESVRLDRHPAFAVALTWLLKCNVQLIADLVLRLAEVERSAVR